MTLLHTVEGQPGALVFWCPGCKCGHKIDSRWEFNGNMERPTFKPSYWCKSVETCHSYITDGSIQFLGDCTHALAGKTVVMEPMP